MKPNYSVNVSPALQPEDIDMLKSFFSRIHLQETEPGVPGQWCGWFPTDNGAQLTWQGSFFSGNPDEWIDYLKNSVLPNYSLTKQDLAETSDAQEASAESEQNTVTTECTSSGTEQDSNQDHNTVEITLTSVTLPIQEDSPEAFYTECEIDVQNVDVDLTEQEPTVKVYSLEDPVEYHIGDSIQVPINSVTELRSEVDVAISQLAMVFEENEDLAVAVEFKKDKKQVTVTQTFTKSCKKNLDKTAYKLFKKFPNEFKYLKHYGLVKNVNTCYDMAEFKEVLLKNDTVEGAQKKIKKLMKKQKGYFVLVCASSDACIRVYKSQKKSKKVKKISTTNG